MSRLSRTSCAFIKPDKHVPVLAIASPGSGEPTGVSQFVAQFLRLRRYCTFLANAE